MSRSCWVAVNLNGILTFAVPKRLWHSGLAQNSYVVNECRELYFSFQRDRMAVYKQVGLLVGKILAAANN